MSWIELCGKNNYLYLQCAELNNHQLIQAFSTENDGNMALHTGDDSAAVVARRTQFLNNLGLSITNLVAAQQVHGREVQIVGAEMLGRGSLLAEDSLSGTDALITKEKGIVLSIFTADCLPIFIYDPVVPAIGVIHAGWRGTIQKISLRALRSMVTAFGTNPADCWVAIGPAIRECCFQVSSDVSETFAYENPSVVSQKKASYTVNLHQFNMDLLTSAGVKPERIINSGICTCCEPERFYSYRAESGTMGRMMGIISLKI